MAFPASLNTVVTEAGELKTALETLVTDLSVLADDIIVQQIGIRKEAVDDNDIHMTIRLQASGVSDANAALFETLKEALTK